MRVLGIDPGSQRCGYGVVEKKERGIELIGAGVIELDPAPLKERIKEVTEGLELVYSRYSPIDLVVIEDIFFAHNPQSVLKLAQIRGAIALKMLQLHGDYLQFTPLQVKRVITGNGKASKEQVAYMVRKILKLGEVIKPFDITDALGIALTPLLLKLAPLPLPVGVDRV